MQKIFIPSIVANGVLWLVGLALEIGGWVNEVVAIILLIIASLWTGLSMGWWLGKREITTEYNAKDRLELKESLTQENATSNRPMTKTEIVTHAIDEARQIIPKGKDVPVYITDANGLKTIYPQELLDILNKLQDDGKMIQLISFPDWLLKHGIESQQDLYEHMRSILHPELNCFVVKILDRFPQ